MAAENSFDIACKLDMQEVANAINQAQREIETRYDLKGAKNEIKQEKMDIILTSADDMKLKAVLDILQSKLHRRGIDLKALTIERSRAGGGRHRAPDASRSRTACRMEKAKEIVRLIKDSKIRVQASIQEKQVRVSGKNRDDLQADHRAGQGQGPGDRAPVHELPLHVMQRSSAPPSSRQALPALQAPAQAQNLNEVFRKANPSVVVIRARGRDVSNIGVTRFSETGSGVLVSADGKVMTAAHVVNAMDEITVEALGGERVSAKSHRLRARRRSLAPPARTGAPEHAARRRWRIRARSGSATRSWSSAPRMGSRTR